MSGNKIFAAILTCVLFWETSYSSTVVSPDRSFTYKIHQIQYEKIYNMLKNLSSKYSFEMQDIGIRLPTSEVIKPVKGRKPFFVSLTRNNVRILVQNFKHKDIITVTLYGKNKKVSGEVVFDEIVRFLKSTNVN